MNCQLTYDVQSQPFPLWFTAFGAAFIVLFFLLLIARRWVPWGLVRRASRATRIADWLFGFSLCFSILFTVIAFFATKRSLEYARSIHRDHFDRVMEGVVDSVESVGRGERKGAYR